MLCFVMRRVNSISSLELKMALTLHPLARTTPRTEAELQVEDPALSHETLARRYGVTVPTARKWCERDSTADRSHCPARLHCTLNSAQEAVAMEYGLAAGRPVGSGA